MEINMRQEKQLAIVTINGNIDALTTKEITAFLSQQIGNGKNRIIIDLSQVNFMGSTGLRIIINALKESRSQNGDLSLAGAQPGVEKILELSGLTDILKTYPTVAEAIVNSGN